MLMESVPIGVKVEQGEEGEKTLPLIIRAVEGKDSVDYLKGWMLENKAWLDAKMLEHGGCGVGVGVGCHLYYCSL